MKRLKRLTAWILIIAVICVLRAYVPQTVSAAAEPRLINDSELLSVAENEKFSFYYDKAGADVYILDKRNKKLYSNNIENTGSGTEEPNAALSSQLFSLSVANKKGNLEQLALSSALKNTSDFKITSVVRDSVLILSIELVIYNISFDLKFWIDDDGLNYSIPSEKIVQNGGYQLVKMNVMPCFGAAAASSDGYIVYPDGCGAVIEFSQSNSQGGQLYNYPVYGTNLQSIDLIKQDDSDDIKNVMLPVYGIKQDDGGIMAAIVEGAGDSSLNIALSGYQINGFHRAYFTFDYGNYTELTINDKSVIKLVPYPIKHTRTVKYFLLSDEENTYSDMAVRYREYLAKENLLYSGKKQDTAPIVLDIFMGISEKWFFFNKLNKATTFSQASGMVDWMKKNDMEASFVSLFGWSGGGYDSTPTKFSADFRLGGNRGLKELRRKCEDSVSRLYLNTDFIFASAQSHEFNKKRDVVRDYQGQIVTDDSESVFIMNPVKTLSTKLKEAFKKLKPDDTVSLLMSHIGNMAVYDYSQKSFTSKQDVINSYNTAIEAVREQSGGVSVDGGNLYAVKNTELLRNIPDTDSGYIPSTYAVPFYQIVVHGSSYYTSVPGNLSHDMTYQKLKWIEYGCVPCFLVTQENPSVLKNTDYNHIFSSEFSVWRDVIKDTYAEFNGKLRAVSDLKIIGHEKLAEDVYRTRYEKGYSVIVNYGGVDYIGTETIVKAMDYQICKED